MASIFKQTYTTTDKKTGRRIRKKTSCWYIDYKAADGTRKRIKGFKDKGATIQLAARLEREAELAAAGIVDRFKEHRKRPLVEHLADFRESLVSKGDTAKHVALVYSRALKVVRGCGFVLWDDINASRVQRYLAGLRSDRVEGKRTVRGVSAQTFNFYLRAIKQFCRWMALDQRAASSPLEHLRPISTASDRRHDRRALEPDEIRRLLEATVNAPGRFGMTGYERALLYRLAIETALRASELRSLKVSSFDFQDRLVIAEAAYCKNRRRASIPLKAETVKLLEEYFAGKLPGASAFPIPGKKCLAEVLRKDLEAAGIEYRDAAGRVVDFHSLRHTAGSLLAASGAHPKVAQSIMRHSTIDLTMNRYSHLYAGQESRAVENLPTFSLSGRDKARATGTDGKALEQGEIAYKPAYKKLAKNAVSGYNRSASIGKTEPEYKKTGTGSTASRNPLSSARLGNKKAPVSLNDNGKNATDGEGFNPPAPQRRIKPLGGRAHRVDQGSEFFDSAFDDITGVEELAGCHADAVRCARGDNVARLQRHEVADKRDYLGDGEDHPGCVGLLPDPAVDAQLHVQVVWIFDLVDGGQVRSQWKETIGPLAVEPVEKLIPRALGAPLFESYAPCGDVVGDAVSGDIIQGFGGGDAACRLADHDSQFQLVINLLAVSGPGDCPAASQGGGGRHQERTRHGGRSR